MPNRPRGRVTTLVATMIDSAITGLYVQTIAEGIRLHAWREPELAALQEQLKQIDATGHRRSLSSRQLGR